MASVRVGGESLILLPQKAAWLPDHRILLIADARIGTTLSFRWAGLPSAHDTIAHVCQTRGRDSVPSFARMLAYSVTSAKHAIIDSVRWTT